MVLLSWLTKILIPESEMIIKMAETKVHLSFQVAMFRAMGVCTPAPFVGFRIILLWLTAVKTFNSLKKTDL